MLLFAIPIVSVDLVEAFACHEVEGRYYLKGDYSIECYTSRWYLMSSYAAIWIVGYIIVFPVFIFHKLFSYHRKMSHGIKLPKDFRYGFLIEDYRPGLPSILCEILFSFPFAVRLSDAAISLPPPSLQGRASRCCGSCRCR